MLQLLEKRSLYQKLLLTSKKLILILIISMPVTNSNKKVVRISCIYYLVQFQEK